MKSGSITEVQINMAKNTYQIFIIIFVLIFLFGLQVQGIIVTMTGFVGIIAAILRIKEINRYSKEIKDFVPYEGFEFYRGGIKNHKFGFISMYTTIELSLVALLLFGFVLKMTIGEGIRGTDSFAVITIIIALIFIEVYFKRIRGLLSKEKILDNQMTVVLKNKGFLAQNIKVNTLYKDFNEIENVVDGNKLLVITENALEYILFAPVDKPKKLIIPYSQIKKFGVMQFAEVTENARFRIHKLLYIGTSNGKKYRINLISAKKFLPADFIPILISDLDKKAGVPNEDEDALKREKLLNIEEMTFTTDDTYGLKTEVNYLDL